MVTNQIFLFLIFVLNGIIIGLLFDFFRIIRRSFKVRDLTTYIQDFLFWILTGLILLYSIFVFNNGEIRLFMFLAVILGGIIYMLLFSKYIIKVNVIIIQFIQKIFFEIITIISIPFKYIYKFVRKIFFKPISFLIINTRKISTNLLKNSYKNIKKSKNSVKN